MASDLDTLNIGSLRLRKELPVAQIQAAERPLDPENHPRAAAAARARIAALREDINPVLHPEAVPATPTADLITDKTTLRTKLGQLDTVSAPRIPSALKPVLAAIGIFALVILLFKSPVIISQIQYSLSKSPAPAAPTAPATSLIPADPTITIPKINVHAPVVYEPSVQEAKIQTALQNGVVHYGNTALPGAIGNAAIFGHSSNDWWEPGNYKFVFVLLDKLVPGDRFTIDYNSVRYTYEVTGSKVVEPTDLSVLNPTATPTVTLITCTPPGTSLRRLVVTAKQVDPAPAGATAGQATSAASTSGTGTTSAGTDQQLPSAAPGFWGQVKNAWNEVVGGFKSLFNADETAAPAGPTPTPENGQIPAVK